MALLFLLLLQVRTKTRPKHHFTKTPSSLFSSKSSSSYLKDLKNQQQLQQQQQQPSHSEPSIASFTNSKQQRSSLDEVRRNHSLFRRSTADTSPLQDKKPVSFQELYGRSVLGKPLEPAGDSGSGNAGRGERYSLDSVRVSLNNIIAAPSGGRRGVDPISLSDYKEALRLRPEDSYSAASSQEKVIGARGDEGVAGDRRRTGPISLTDFKATLRLRPSDPSSATAALSPGKAIDMRGAGGFSGYRRGIDPISLQEYKDALSCRPPDSWSASAAPTPEKLIRGTSISQGSVFGREMRKKIDRDGSSAASRSGIVRVYGYGELGGKLRKLRPEVKGRGKEWFSIGELNERLMRLRENEEKEAVMSECLVLVNEINNENSRKSSLQKSDIISQLGRNPSYILDPPKEHPFEKIICPQKKS